MPGIYRRRSQHRRTVAREIGAIVAPGPVAKSGADSQAIAAAETGVISASLGGADTQVIGATESATVAVSGSDTQAVDEAEVGSVAASLQANDAGATRPWIPTDLGSELLAEFRGSDIGLANAAQITDWDDASANDFDATGAGGSNRPTYDEANQAANFVRASSQFLDVAEVSASVLDRTYVVVYDVGDTSNEGTIIGSSANGGLALDIDIAAASLRVVKENIAIIGSSSGAVPTSGFQVLRATVGATTWSVSVNGTANGGSHGQSLTASRTVTLGKHSGLEYADGKLKHAVLAEALSAADAERLEGFLAHEYGLETNLDAAHPYKSSPPMVSSSGFIASTETATNNRVGSDTQAIAVSETSSSDVSLSGSDTQVVDGAETGVLTALLSGGDTQAIDESESTDIVITEVKSGADSQALATTESAALDASLLGTDVQAIATSESVAIDASLTGVDTQAIATSEGSDISEAEVQKSGSDTQGIGATEAVSLVAETSASDGGIVVGGESWQIAASLAGADEQAVGVAENAEVFQPPEAKSGSDTQPITELETSALSATIGAADTQPLAATESALLGAEIASSDTQAIAASETDDVESVVSIAQKSGQDVQIVVLTETAAVGLVGIDTQRIGVVEWSNAVDNLVPVVATVQAVSGVPTIGGEGGVTTTTDTGYRPLVTGIGYPPVVVNEE